MPFLSSSKRRQNTGRGKRRKRGRKRKRKRRRRKKKKKKKKKKNTGPLSSRQTGGRPGELMFYRCYLLSFSSSFLTIAWSKEI